MKKIKIFIMIIFISLFIFYMYSRCIEPYLLKTKEISFSDNINSSYDGLKIVHFSDLLYHEGYNLEKIKDEINLINPDLIFFTGDLIKNKLNNKEKELLTSFLNEINAKYGKYAILGDNDYKDIENIKLVYNNSGFILIDNSYEIIFNENNDKLLLANYNKFDDLNDVSSFFNKDLNDVYKIILIHKPDDIDYLLNNNINPNLVLAGHSLYGCINIPYLKIRQDGAKKYLNDYYRINNINFYINNGLSTLDNKIRFNNIPSINFYRINKT